MSEFTRAQEYEETIVLYEKEWSSLISDDLLYYSVALLYLTVQLHYCGQKGVSETEWFSLNSTALLRAKGKAVMQLNNLVITTLSQRLPFDSLFAKGSLWDRVIITKFNSITESERKIFPAVHCTFVCVFVMFVCVSVRLFVCLGVCLCVYLCECVCASVWESIAQSDRGTEKTNGKKGEWMQGKRMNAREWVQGEWRRQENGCKKREWIQVQGNRMNTRKENDCKENEYKEREWIQGEWRQQENGCNREWIKREWMQENECKPEREWMQGKRNNTRRNECKERETIHEGMNARKENECTRMNARRMNVTREWMQREWMQEQHGSQHYIYDTRTYIYLYLCANNTSSVLHCSGLFKKDVQIVKQSVCAKGICLRLFRQSAPVRHPSYM